MPITLGRGEYDLTPSSALSGYSSLSRLARNRYDFEEHYRYTSPTRAGTVRGGATPEHVYELLNDPMKYTVIAPVKGLGDPVLGNRRPRTGNFTLDLVDWNETLGSATGDFMGRESAIVGPSQWGEEGVVQPQVDPQLDWFAARNITMENAPKRLMDYALAPFWVLTGNPGVTNGAAPGIFPFQNSPNYWRWLEASTPAQRKQQAQAIADSRADRNRNAPLYEQLLYQFELDYKTRDALSSGNVRYDFIAKQYLQRNPDIDTFLNPDFGNLEKAEIRSIDDWVAWQEGWTQNTNPTGGRDMGLSATSAMYVPFVGTQLGEFFDPINPETEKKWLALTPEERSHLLANAGFVSAVGDLTGAFPIFSGIGKAAAFLGSAQKVESWLTAARFPEFASRLNLSAEQAHLLGQMSAGATKMSSRSLNAVNKLMALGLVNMTASWAMQSFAPMDSEWGAAMGEAGRKLDAARPISTSAVGGLLNEAGFFAGIYGIDVVLGATVRGIARGATAEVRGKRLFGGTPDTDFYQQGFGGSQLGTVLADDYGIDVQFQRAALSAEYESSIINARKADLAGARMAVERGEPTGLPTIDAIEDTAERVRAWEAEIASSHEASVKNVGTLIDIVNSRTQGGQVAKVARAIDRRVTDYMMSRYGALRWPAKVDDLKGLAAKYLNGYGAKTDIGGLERYAGKDPEKWLQVVRRLHQNLFHKRHVEMLAIAEEAGEDATRFAMFSQRTLFADEIDRIAVELADADPAVGLAAMRRLIETKDDIQLLYGERRFGTPEELIDVLESIRGVLPTRRIPEEGLSLLDDWQTVLDNEGVWTVGYKPSGAFVRVEPWVRVAAMAPPPGVQRVPLTPDDLRAMGYRQPYQGERMRGPEFRDREPVWPIEEYGGGVWVKERPGDAPPSMTTAASSTANALNVRLATLADPYTYPIPEPDSYYLTAAIEDGTQSYDWLPGPSKLFRDAGVSSLEAEPGMGHMIDDSWLNWNTRNLNEAPTRTVDDITGAWESGTYYLDDRPEVTKAGVVIFEKSPDGSIGIWAIKPVDKVTGQPFLGYDLTFPKGGRESGESLVRTAVREMVEETGMDADIVGHLGDFADDAGTEVRYFLARRRAGGPDFATTPDEIGSMELVDPAALAQRLTRNGRATRRDLDAYGMAVEQLSLKGYTGGTPKMVHGRNRYLGASYPILESSYTGRKYIFKAERGGYEGAPLKDYPKPVRYAAPLATKLVDYLGLGVAGERPFTWEGVRGTIQEFVEDADPLDLSPQGLQFADGMFLNHGGPDVVDELQRQHVADWFTSQHDSNSDSMLIAANGKVTAIDKGQAWKFFGKGDENAAFNDPEGFWLFGQDNSRWVHPTAGDKHLGSFLWDYWQAGGRMDRGAVEDVLLKIEAIDDVSMENWLREFADARAWEGWGNADDFIDMMKARRDNMREAVNAAYVRMGQIAIPKPGEMARFAPTQTGSMKIDGPVPLNAPLKPMAVNPDLREPVLDVPDGHTAMVGVLVEEADGRIWAASNPAGPGRYLPRNIIHDPLDLDGVHLSATSVVETNLGLSVRLDEHIADIAEGTLVTRWYRATRTGGGPQYASVPTHGDRGIVMGTVDQVRVDPYTGEVINGVEALDALDQLRAPQPAPQTAAPSGPLPGVEPERIPDEQYTSYAVLPDGSVFRSPWVDYPIPHVRDVELGNRAILSQKLDAVFRGWRSSRIVEMQKGVLYRRLDGIAPGFTAAKVGVFHEGLMDLARKHGFAGVQPLGLSRFWPEVGGMASVYDEVVALAEEVFGKGPYLMRDGTYGTVNWGREIAKAYRTSHKLNLTAGLTSQIKAMGGVGGRVAFLSDVAYPAFRFAFSPLFKAGEWAEAPILNAMRGINPFGMDDVQRSIWQRSGLPTSGAEYAENSLTDPMLAAAGRSITRNQGLRRGWLSAPAPKGAGEEIARRRTGVVTPADELQPPSALMGKLFPADPARTRPYPDLPEHSVESLIPHKIDPVTGEPVFDVERMKELDAERLKDYVDSRLRLMVNDAVNNPEALERLAWGVGYLDSLGPDFPRRLAEHVPLVHTLGRIDADDDLDNIERWLEEGLTPLAGPAGRGQDDIAATVLETGETSFTVPRGNTSNEEVLTGHLDAPYIGQDYWSLSSSENAAFILRNERVLPRSVIVDNDRISYFRDGPSPVLQQHIMSANGALDIYEAAIRMRLIQSVKDRLTSGTQPPKDMTDVLRHAFSATSPVEHALPNGGGWEDISAIVLQTDAQAQRWYDLVAAYGDQVPAIRDIDVIIGRETENLWKHAFERAGLSDRYHDVFEPSMLDEGSIPRIVPDELITPETLDGVEPVIQGELTKYGYSAPQVRFSLEDRIRGKIAELRKEATRTNDDLSRKTVESGSTGGQQLLDTSSDKADFAENVAKATEVRERKEAKATILEGLLEELTLWRQRQTRDSTKTSFDLMEVDDFGRAKPEHQAEMDEIQSFYDDWSEYKERARVAGVEVPVIGEEHTGQFSVWEVLDQRAASEGRIPPPKGVLPPGPPKSNYGNGIADEASAAAMYREINDWLGTHRAELADGSGSVPTFMHDGQRENLVQSLVTMDFLDDLRAQAERVTGQSQPNPIVKVWMRASGKEQLSKATEPGEIVITVTWPDGANPLSLEEITASFVRSSFPSTQALSEGGAQPPWLDIWWDQGILWTPEGGPAGSLLVRGSTGSADPNGTMDIDPATGLWAFYPDKAATWQPSSIRPIEILYSFDKGSGKAAWNMSDRRFSIDTAVEEVSDAYAVPGGSNAMGGNRWRFLASKVGRGNDWSYSFAEHPAAVDVFLPSHGSSATRAATEASLRDAFSKFPDKPIKVNVERLDDLVVIARLKTLGELPDGLVVVRKGSGWPDAHTTPGQPGWSFEKVATDEEIAAALPRRPQPEPVPDSLDEVPGSPEHLTESVWKRWRQEIAAAPAGAKERLEAGFEAAWNPVPYKQRQQDRLIRDIASEWFPDVMRESSPETFRLYTQELGVPESDLVDYILEDRMLLDRWVETGSDEDFVRLVNHADKYGITKGNGRADLDSLYESPDWQTVTELMHWTAKAAADEGFAVHFFNPYRSAFERSLNHPLLGVYPASWSYKIAKEWFRFLYKNETFGFRLGMQPARAISNFQAAQSAAFARDEDQDLDQFLDDGPMSSSIFVFNLLMPGDWSGIPFPLSRSLRDMLRGNFNPADHLRNNLFSMGLGRDARLATEVFGEVGTLVTDTPPERRRGEVPVEEMLRR